MTSTQSREIFDDEDLQEQIPTVDEYLKQNTDGQIFADVKTYLTKISTLQTAYNKDPIPVWMCDAVGKYLADIEVWTSKINNGVQVVFQTIQKPSDVAQTTPQTTLNSTILTWWMLRRGKSVLQIDTEESFKKCQTNTNIHSIVHDTWAMSTLFPLAPMYDHTKNNVVLIACVDNTMQLFEIQNGKNKVSLDYFSAEHKITINGIGMRGDYVKLMVEHAKIKDEIKKNKYADIGATLLYFVTKMENEYESSVQPITRALPSGKTLKTVFQTETVFQTDPVGGAPRLKKKPSSGKKKKVVRRKSHLILD